MAAPSWGERVGGGGWWRLGVGGVSEGSKGGLRRSERVDGERDGQRLFPRELEEDGRWVLAQ